jgi:Zn-dependent protease with chaperone function
MNFYEHQDRAEKRTKIIVFLFVLCVLCIISIVAIPVGFATEWQIEPLAITIVVCLLIVGIATLVKLGQLRGGGSVVAEMMGGVQLQQGGSTQSEKRVQNIVEEMAIASGMAVPPVYIMEDDSINAFAAGWSPNNAVISVTRGCIEKLSRDELQGVIAHEYSHIAHGDMRMNIRLIGVIFGIMALGITGWVMVRFIGPAILHSASRSRSKEGAGGAGIGLGIIVLGFFLVLCGCIGTFFGRLIQAAVSRQREFLADASAVQYTRNPLGIGGALRKIGGITPLLKTPADASQCNHMFFSQAMNAMFASHPPVAERISRIEGIDIALLPNIETATVTTQGASGFSSSVVVETIESAGEIKADYENKAHAALANIDKKVLDAARDPWSVRLVLFALLTIKEDVQQQKILAKNLSVPEWTEFQSLSGLLATTKRVQTLPLIDFSAPAISQLRGSQKSEFTSLINSLVQSDGVVDLQEWVFLAVLHKHVNGTKKQKQKQSASLRSLEQSVLVVIGALAYCGATSQDQANSSFKEAVSSIGFKDTKIPEIALCSVGKLGDAVEQLCVLKYTEKEKLLNACAACVAHDGQITFTEAETLRAIGDLLDCPIPVF